MDFGYSRGRDSLLRFPWPIFTFPFVVVVVVSVSVAVPAAVEPRFSLVFSSFFSPF